MLPFADADFKDFKPLHTFLYNYLYHMPEKFEHSMVRITHIFEASD